MIPVPPLTLHPLNPNHADLPWCVWTLRDAEGRDFLRGKDKVGLEVVMLAVNERWLVRRALAEIVHLAAMGPGKRYALARAIAENALEGRLMWTPEVAK